jgi:hypothetical protein
MTTIDFSRLARRNKQDTVTGRSFSALHIRIHDKRLLMMIQDIRGLVSDTVTAQDVIESCIISTYNTLQKEQKL